MASGTRVVGTHVRLDGTYPIYGQDNFSGRGFLDALKEKLSVNIIVETDDSIEFDLVGIEAPLANALRRILLAEVPTVAVESVYILDNSSIIQDEVLAHRLGLVPLNVDPRTVHFLNEGDAATDSNTLVFKMDVTGEAPPAAEDGAPLRRFHHVYSSDFQWVPQGEQGERYAAAPPAPVHSDILLAKLQPGQRIAVEMHAVKGVGKDHAKFSPVATASYRLLPAVKLLQPVYDDDAEELAARSKVFDAVPCTDGSGHKLQAVPVRPRLCNMSREILRDPKFADKVHISRVSDHFIFSVETTGALKPREIVQEAFAVLKEKCQVVEGALQTWVEGGDGDAADAASQGSE